ncbi:MAG: hypothetical protein JNK60_00450 [Acidobacteria bacterium]|nr:hypothetical protein [Acidobacteriota bacterium]
MDTLPAMGSERRLSGEDSGPPFAVAALVLGGLAATRFLALSAEPGEIDEAVFAGAVTHFDLFDLSPQAPGFPVWILLGRALRPLCVGPYESLVIASTLLATLLFPALYVWGRRLVGGWEALAGCLLSGFLPVVWVNGGRAFTDTPATGFFLLSLALLATSTSPRGAAVAGLLAAAGAGVRPHLVLMFGPLFLLETIVLVRKGHRAEALAFVLAGLLGTGAWTAWLLAQAGGIAGLFSSVGERAAFRSQAFATGTFGTLEDSFLVRDALSLRRALCAGAALLAGAVALGLSKERRTGLLRLALVLLPGFLSLWFLHSRAMSRYSVPLVAVAALLAGAGLVAALRRPVLAFGASIAIALVFAKETLPVVRAQSREASPPIAAIRALERDLHPGRHTIVADEIFHAFLRLERWEGRLGAWALQERELATTRPTRNKRLLRIADLTAQPAADGAQPSWRVWSVSGRVVERLGNARLLRVGIADPAPPLFGPGFGVKEVIPGKPAFRWSGPSAELLVPGLEGPPAAFLAGERTGPATRLLVKDLVRGQTLVERVVEPGAFELAILPAQTQGPLPDVSRYAISCDTPLPLPPFPGGLRPERGCFVFREATLSLPAGALWERQGRRRVADLGGREDRRVSPAGFHAREEAGTSGTSLRWTSGDAAVTFVPETGFVPAVLALRARAPFDAGVSVLVSIAEKAAGHLEIPPGAFNEVRLGIPPDVAAAFLAADPVMIRLRMATTTPKEKGQGEDPRPLGIAVDRVILEAAAAAQDPSR